MPPTANRSTGLGVPQSDDLGCIVVGCKLLQRHVVEDGGDRVADIAHRLAHMTVDRVGAIIAGLKRGAAGAADRRQRPIQRADDLADADVGGGTRQRIAAARALLRAKDAGIAQFEKDRVQELLRNIVSRGDLGDEGGLSGLKLSQVDKGLEPVFSFLVNMSLRFREQESRHKAAPQAFAGGNGL